MLPGELFNKRNKTIRVKTSTVIPFHRLSKIETDEAMIEYLRLRTYLLANSPELKAKKQLQFRLPGNLAQLLRKNATPPLAIVQPENPETMRREITALPESLILARQGEFTAICAYARQIPSVMREIGRLREITFRAANEGTGKAADIDRFDSHYLHLFIWNSEKNEIAGAYRLGKTDEILNEHGTKGLYTTTLFRYGQRFLDKISPALEMGRSFVRPEYQKSYVPLLLLWKGIGQIVAANPQYRYLFGPVSINKDYSATCSRLIVSFLKMTSYIPSLARHVRPKTPMRAERIAGWEPEAAMSFVRDIDDVSELIAAIAASEGIASQNEQLSPPKAVPILLKQYLRLGGKVIGFNIDHSFGDCLDGLILVDLTLTEPAVLSRYMGKDGIDAFYKYHGRTSALCA